MTAKQYREGFDLVAKLLDAMRHMGIVENKIVNQQFMEPYYALMKHPAMKEAGTRRKQEYWDSLARVAARVDKWPAWMKGERENKRTRKGGTA